MAPEGITPEPCTFHLPHCLSPRFLPPRTANGRQRSPGTVPGRSRPPHLEHGVAALWRHQPARRWAAGRGEPRRDVTRRAWPRPQRRDPAPKMAAAGRGGGGSQSLRPERSLCWGLWVQRRLQQRVLRAPFFCSETCSIVWSFFFSGTGREGGTPDLDTQKRQPENNVDPLPMSFVKSKHYSNLK